MQDTAKKFIEREKQTKKVGDTIGLVRTGHNRPSANGTQGPERGTAREMKKETKS